MISRSPLELPDHIVFLSTGEELDIKEDVFDYQVKKVNGRTVRTKIKSSSSTYVYTKVT